MGSTLIRVIILLVDRCLIIMLFCTSEVNNKTKPKKKRWWMKISCYVIVVHPQGSFFSINQKY